MGKSDSDAPVGLADDLGLLLTRLGTITRLRLADALAPLGLTMRQYAVLRALDAAPGLSQAALGEKLQIDASSIVLVLDDCQNAGWSERRPSPTDRRRYALHLTPAGRRTLIRARQAAADAQQELFSPLAGGQRTQLHDLLLQVASGQKVASSTTPAAARSKAV